MEKGDSLHLQVNMEGNSQSIHTQRADIIDNNIQNNSPYQFPLQLFKDGWN